MTRVAVIGAGGQLGQDLVDVLRAGDHAVIPLHHAEIECTDIASVRGALLQTRPDVVVNCAAFVRVDDCEDHPATALSVNALGALHVARVCADLGAVCVYISTDYVFDGTKATPYREEDLASPLNVYGASKLAGECFVRMATPRHLVVRTSGLYGVSGSTGKGGNFVEAMMQKAAAGAQVRVVDDQRLTPTYARDLARVLEALVRRNAVGVYHVTNGGECTWYEFASKIFELTKMRVDLAPTTSAAFSARAQRPAYSVLAPEALRAMGLPVLRPWDEALPAYLEERAGRLARV